MSRELEIRENQDVVLRERQLLDAFRPLGEPVGRRTLDSEYLDLTAKQTAFTDAFQRARLLGRAMLAEFDAMDRARRELSTTHGIHIAVEFPPAIQAAMLRHRDLLGDPADLPEWLRANTDSPRRPSRS